MTNKAKAAGRGTRTAFKTAHQQTYYSAQQTGEQGGKAHAMFLFNIGTASFQETQAQFASNSH